MSVDQALVEQWLDACEAHADRLSTWELSFLESVRAQYESRGSLTDRQAEVLERIYAEKTP